LGKQPPGSPPNRAGGKAGDKDRRVPEFRRGGRPSPAFLGSVDPGRGQGRATGV